MEDMACKNNHVFFAQEVYVKRKEKNKTRGKVKSNFYAIQP
jgi:hypothetical protein